MYRFLRALWHIVAQGGTRAPGLMMAFICISRGIWLMLPMDTFGTSSVYGAFAEHGISEWLLGGVFLLVGLVEILALGLNNLKFRRVGAAAMTVLWSFFAGLGWAGDAAGLAPITSTMFALFTMWISARLSYIFHSREL